MILEALSAAPAAIALDAVVKDWDDNVLREGSGDWVCMPSPPGYTGTPMCLDEVWQELAHAWMNQQPFRAKRLGLGYMLQGDSGGSNIDPYATEPEPDNEWVVTGAHLMVVVPDPAALEGLPTDPYHGGPYVMWKGTPYAHIMVPVH